MTRMNGTRKTESGPITRDTPLTALKGVGEKTAALFSKRGLVTVGDLLEYYPRSYDTFTAPITVDQLKEGETASCTLTIVGKGSVVHAGRYRITTFHAADVTGQIRLTWFNMPYLVKTILPGSVHVFRGRIRRYRNGSLCIEQPSIYTPAEYEKLGSTLQPRYPLTEGQRNSQLIRMMHRVLEDDTLSGDADSSLIAEYLTEQDRRELDLMSESEATCRIHFPRSEQELVRARNRKVFDEFVAFLMAVKRQKAFVKAVTNDRPMIPAAQTKRLIEALPYELTDSQRQAWSEIENDLTGPALMNRLLQGDVGSGKTILAFLALILCACNGRQGAMMAPTEVLASQHMENLVSLIRQYHLPVHPVLLTGSVKGAARRKAYEDIASGEADIILGTHALIQDRLQYHDLSLVITDEQHRFGVHQRESLAGKGAAVPVLVMSATPIPRTLSIILYGDLQVSRLTQKPKNRLPIRNLAMSMHEEGKALRFLLNETKKGRQAYIICPAIERGEDDASDLSVCGAGILPDAGEPENVTDFADKLRASIPESVSIGVLHGRMKPAQKEKVMNAFAAHELDILVSTTVIEVGIDVPNATVILILNAERFGLSQLHQLRGRVGRGAEQSYCMFLYSEQLKEKPKRLEILEHSNDGFDIAEQDLKLRGPGDLFGVRQSGEMGFRLADLCGDTDILTMASDYVDRLLKEHPDAVLPMMHDLDLRSI